MPRDLTAETKPHADGIRSVVIPFIIFTAIWGSTWIVIRGQLGAVPPQWSVAYRFAIAAVAMALVAWFKGDSLKLGRKGLAAALFLGFFQFSVNFNAVYLAERHITSGVVATVFALLLIPASLLGWALLGQRPTQRFAWSSLVAVAGIVLLFMHEIREHPADSRADRNRDRPDTLRNAWRGDRQCRPGAAAKSANSRCSRCSPGRWRAGAVIEAIVAFLLAGPPVFERPVYWAGLLYLALPPRC